MLLVGVRRRVEFELQVLRLERLARRLRAAALCPMGDDLVRPAGPVGDLPVERLDAQASVGVAGDQGVEAPAEPVDLDDVPGLDPFEPHRLKGTWGRFTDPCTDR